MLRGFRSRLTYANLMATAAVFIALGGASYAAVKLPKNSVGASQIKRNSITGAKVKNGSLTGADVRDRSLTPADFNGSVQGPQGAKGDPGPSGPAGIGPAFRAVRIPAPGEDSRLTSDSPPTTTVATLKVPAGSYALFSTVEVIHDTTPPVTTEYSADCRLTAGADRDTGRVITDAGTRSVQVTSQVLHTFAAAGTVSLACGDALLSPAIWQKAIITAIQVSSVTSTGTDVPPGV